jgi:4-alpha-glucanotransferase
MSKPSLALVVHFHQPVANLDDVVRKATDRCYRPFLETLASFPSLPATLHFSGCLLEWLETNAPDVPALLRELVSRGRVEVMTGGFYEPILAALPRRDQRGQIEMMSAHLRDRYGAEPSGAWLTERAWEQDLVPALAEAGVRYTVVDDTMFHAVGVGDERLPGPFITDHEGKTLLVYAGDRNLRYLIPYKSVDRVLHYLESSPQNRFFVYADDGEKFGEWPGTYEHVYERGWLKSFFAALSSRDHITLTTLGEHSVSAPVAGRVYLPSSAYDEMMNWALPSEARLVVGRFRRELEKDDPRGILPFVKGAPWRAFLAKYPEVNLLHKRMFAVSSAVHESNGSPEALRELYRAQCNCAYWHGAFGGTYLSFMRCGLWHHLLRAEAEVARREVSVAVADVDADGSDEVVLSAPWGAAIVAPHRGARLLELDDLQVGANLLSVMARRREAYHIADESSLGQESKEEARGDEMEALEARVEIDRESIVFDEDGTGALIDCVNGERVTAPYDYEVSTGAVKASVEQGALRIEKQLAADDDCLRVGIQVTNISPAAYEGAYGAESFVAPLNLGRGLEDATVDVSSSGWRACAPEAEVCLDVSIDPFGATSWERVTTASATLEGLQEIPQGVRVVTEWKIDLPPGQTHTVTMTLRPSPTGIRDKKDRGL